MGKIENLEQIRKLKDNGVLSEKEFEIEKQKIFNTVENNNRKSHKSIIIGITIILAVLTLLSFFIVFNTNNSKPKEIQLPNLVGLTLEQAQRKTDKLGLKIKVIQENEFSKNSKRYIIRQIPKFQENFLIKEGTVINVILGE